MQDRLVWLLERFDTDGDGQLSEQERAAAHQAMEQGRQRERERREALFDRFDADDDGKLDRDELGAWMRWNFEQGRNRPPRPGGPRPPDDPPRDSADAPPAKPADSAPAVHPPL